MSFRLLKKKYNPVEIGVPKEFIDTDMKNFSFPQLKVYLYLLSVGTAKSEIGFKKMAEAAGITQAEAAEALRSLLFFFEKKESSGESAPSEIVLRNLFSAISDIYGRELWVEEINTLAHISKDLHWRSGTIVFLYDYLVHRNIYDPVTIRSLADYWDGMGIRTVTSIKKELKKQELKKQKEEKIKLPNTQKKRVEAGKKSITQLKKGMPSATCYEEEINKDILEALREAKISDGR